MTGCNSRTVSAVSRAANTTVYSVRHSWSFENALTYRGVDGLANGHGLCVAMPTSDAPLPSRPGSPSATLKTDFKGENHTKVSGSHCGPATVPISTTRGAIRPIEVIVPGATLVIGGFAGSTASAAPGVSPAGPGNHSLCTC